MNAVTVIVPALNEGARLAATLADLRRSLVGWKVEVLIIDDGSSDASTAGLESRPDVLVTRHDEPLGYGYSIKEGVRLASHDLIAIIDADGTYRGADLLHLLQDAHRYEMVVGARTGRGARIPLIRRPAKWLLRRLAEYVAGTRIPDLNSGLRVFRRETALKNESILPNAFSFTTTITLAVLADGRPVKFVPIEYLAREGKSKSKIRPIRDTMYFTGLIVRMACLFRPLKIFVPIGLFVLGLAAVRLGWDILVLDDVGDSAPLLVTSGLQITLMGLIAELVVRRR